LVGLLTLAALAYAPYVQIEQLEQSRVLGNGRLAAFLSSGDRQVALRAALAIGRTKQPAGLSLLERRAGDRDPAMRAIAVYGIGLIGGSDAAGPVLRALNDTPGAVLVAALDATIRLESAHSFNPAQAGRALARVTALQSSPDEIVRARAATTLSSFTQTASSRAAAMALSRAFAREKSAFVRWHIMWSLYRGYASEAPRTTLLAGLRDRDEVVRIEAVRAFGRRDDRRDASVLAPLMGDASWRVQEQTRESLAVLTGGKMTEHLGAIPSGVHTPAPIADALASIRALPRTAASGKPAPPDFQAVDTRANIEPGTIAGITGPGKGPHPRARIVTTAGNIYLTLYPEWAPLTVENFFNLANEGYYDNNPWFRIVPDFVVQSGDPSADAPGPGYTIPAEENPIEQDSYCISMGLDYTNGPNAHAKRDSAASEFYITLSPQLHLNSDFTVFGRVTSGFDVLGRLVESDKILRVERLPDSLK
jgi:cyclophilin family peptidyl-prolyl cis-trans isomerase/HEAT repeat protein